MTSSNTNRKTYENGFSSVELIVVLAIIGILATLVVPSFVSYRQKVKEQVCNTNCLQLEKMYHTYLFLKGVDHGETVFSRYLQEYDEVICLDHGLISYVNGKIQCKVHNNEGDEDKSVPYL